MPLRALFMALQILGQKPRYILETRHITRVHGHEGLMRFQTRAGDLFARRIRGNRRLRRALVGHGRVSACHLEKAQRAEVFQQLRDAGIWIEQFNGRPINGALGHFQSKSSQDSEKRAVNERAFRKINDKAVTAFLREAGQECFQIRTAREIGAAHDFHTSGLVVCQDQNFCR